MKKFTNNQWGWTWVVTLIILPCILVRVFEGGFMRILSMLVVLGFFPAFLFFASVLISKGKFLINPQAFEKRYGERTLNITTIIFRMIGVVAGILLFIWITIPAYVGVFKYVILDKALVIVEGTVKDVNTGIIDPVGFVSQDVQLENENTRYSIWYSDIRMRVGEKYQFELLPDTNLIVNLQQQ